MTEALNLVLDPRTVTRRLDEAESLAIGSGMLELKAYAKPTSVGGAVDYVHRLTDNLSAFGTGYGGLAQDSYGDLRPEWGAMAGMRLRW